MILSFFTRRQHVDSCMAILKEVTDLCMMVVRSSEIRIGHSKKKRWKTVQYVFWINLMHYQWARTATICMIKPLRTIQT